MKFTMGSLIYITNIKEFKGISTKTLHIHKKIFRRVSMKNLIKAIKYLQVNDSNGTYVDILEEIENGELTIEEGKAECISILERWQEENLGSTDKKEYNKIQELIDSLQ